MDQEVASQSPVDTLSCMWVCIFEETPPPKWWAFFPFKTNLASTVNFRREAAYLAYAQWSRLANASGGSVSTVVLLVRQTVVSNFFERTSTLFGVLVYGEATMEATEFEKGPPARCPFSATFLVGRVPY